MGENVVSADDIFKNLNKSFGGGDYYGIHAPPFIDLLAKYGLSARPLYINSETISYIKKALYSDHIIMVWIKIGYNSPIDKKLYYGNVKIIRGEHAVDIIGYDKENFIIMDPAIGDERKIKYADLLNASASFPVPFLDVYAGNANLSLDDITLGFDKLTQIDRSLPKIYLKNGSGLAGASEQLRNILKDFGYTVVSVVNAKTFDYQGLNISYKANLSDFYKILKRDLEIASYDIASESSDMNPDGKEDIEIIVGQ